MKTQTRTAKKRVDPKKVERKMRKLARRLAEANTWTSVSGRRTMATFADVFTEAFQLIRLTGYFDEYERREKQIQKARMS